MRLEITGVWDEVESAGPYAINPYLTHDHNNTSSLNFYGPDALPDDNVKALKACLRANRRHNILFVMLQLKNVT